MRAVRERIHRLLNHLVGRLRRRARADEQAPSPDDAFAILAALLAAQYVPDCLYVQRIFIRDLQPPLAPFFTLDEALLEIVAGASSSEGCPLDGWRRVVLAIAQAARRGGAEEQARNAIAVLAEKFRSASRSMGASYRSLADLATQGFARLVVPWQIEVRRPGVLLRWAQRVAAALLRRALALSYAASPPTPPGRLVVSSARVLRGPNCTDRTWTCLIGGGAAA